MNLHESILSNVGGGSWVCFVDSVILLTGDSPRLGSLTIEEQVREAGAEVSARVANAANAGDVVFVCIFDF
jgi:hypothetical protein